MALILDNKTPLNNKATLSGKSPMRTYLLRRANSFICAFRGIAIVFKTQANAQLHILATAIIVGLGFWLQLSSIEWCFIILCIAMVLAAEAINTAVEFVVDLACPEFHHLAGKAKDVAAGAVLISVIICGFVWGIIYIPKLVALFI